MYEQMYNTLNQRSYKIEDNTFGSNVTLVPGELLSNVGPLKYNGRKNKTEVGGIQQGQFSYIRVILNQFLTFTEDTAASTSPTLCMIVHTDSPMLEGNNINNDTCVTGE